MTDIESPGNHNRGGLFEKVLFWALVPGIVLALVSAYAIIYIRSADADPRGYGFDVIPAMAATCMILILVGTMILRTTMYLRRRSVALSRRLPRRAAWSQFWLYLALIIWPVAFAVRADPSWIVFATAIVVLPCLDHASIPRLATEDRTPITDALPPHASRVPLALGAVLIVAIALSVAGIGGGGAEIEAVGSALLWFVALPWSYPLTLAFIGVLAVLPESGHYQSEAFVIVFGIAAAANVLVAWRATRSDAAYQRFANRFFRTIPRVDDAQDSPEAQSAPDPARP